MCKKDQSILNMDSKNDIWINCERNGSGKREIAWSAWETAENEEIFSSWKHEIVGEEEGKTVAGKEVERLLTIWMNENIECDKKNYGIT